MPKKKMSAEKRYRNVKSFIKESQREKPAKPKSPHKGHRMPRGKPRRAKRKTSKKSEQTYLGTSQQPAHESQSPKWRREERAKLGRKGLKKKFSRVNNEQGTDSNGNKRSKHVEPTKTKTKGLRTTPCGNCGRG